MAVLGVVVLIVALFALHEPAGHNASAAKDTASSGKSTAKTTATASSSSRRSSSPSTRSSGPSLDLGSSTASTTDTAKARKVPLVVLNNSTISGLAAQAADTFRAGGWTVNDTGNLQNNIISTCAYYDTSSAGSEAAAQALQNQFPAIKRVEPKFAELPAGPVVVVLTSDYTSG